MLLLAPKHLLLLLLVCGAESKARNAAFISLVEWTRPEQHLTELPQQSYCRRLSCKVPPSPCLSCKPSQVLGDNIIHTHAYVAAVSESATIPRMFCFRQMRIILMVCTITYRQYFFFFSERESSSRRTKPLNTCVRLSRVKAYIHTCIVMVQIDIGEASLRLL